MKSCSKFLLILVKYGQIIKELMLQEQGDRPARPGRPSLIASGGEAEPARQILSSLDAKPATARPAGAAPKKPAKLIWAGLGIGVVAVAGAVFSLSGGPESEPPVMVAAAPAAAPAPAAKPAAVSPPAPEAPAAAIVNDVPAAPMPAPQPSVTEVLAAPAKPAPAPKKPVKKDQLTQALERPAKKKAPEPKAENKKAAANKAREEAAKAAKKPVDNDAALLAALLEHSRGKKATPAEQLKVCKQYNAAGEEQCRTQLCATVARKEPACKTKAQSKT